MKSLAEILDEKRTLTTGTKVGMPLFHEMYVYGYTIANADINDLFFDGDEGNLSCLGPVDVYSNRAVCKGQTHAIFTSVSIPDIESILLRNAYIPRMIRGKYKNYFYLNHVRRRSSFDTQKVANSRFENGEYFYDLELGDLVFQSDSRMIGVGKRFCVICSRKNEKNGEIIYESYSPDQLFPVK